MLVQRVRVKKQASDEKNLRLLPTIPGKGGGAMKRRGLVFLSIFFALSLVFIAQNHAQNGVKGGSGYVGSEVCQDCHETQYNKFMKSVHGKKAIPGSPANNQECESCHGPGAEHVAKEGGKGVAIFAFSNKESAADRDAKCLACHKETKDIPFWNLSKHQSADITCDNCHSIHSPVQRTIYLKAAEPDLCFSCHKNIMFQTNKQSHHPIREGKIECSSCHNTMGTPYDGKAMIKADTVNELCYKCHAEKRGPFAFEHPPVEENCLTCHDIHGSNHSRLLTRRVPLLCQSCHNLPAHPSQPYTNLHSFSGSATSAKNRFFGRSCLNCHGNIHGSSLSPAFNR
jgi:DmsE family decaheme c-type cytochrome